MRCTSGPGFNSRWRPNIFNSVLFKKACERERIRLKITCCYVYVNSNVNYCRDYNCTLLYVCTYYIIYLHT